MVYNIPLLFHEGMIIPLYASKLKVSQNMDSVKDNTWTILLYQSSQIFSLMANQTLNFLAQHARPNNWSFHSS